MDEFVQLVYPILQEVTPKFIYLNFHRIIEESNGAPRAKKKLIKKYTFVPKLKTSGNSLGVPKCNCASLIVFPVFLIFFSHVYFEMITQYKDETFPMFESTFKKKFDPFKGIDTNMISKENLISMLQRFYIKLDEKDKNMMKRLTNTDIYDSIDILLCNHNQNGNSIEHRRASIKIDEFRKWFEKENKYMYIENIKHHCKPEKALFDDNSSKLVNNTYDIADDIFSRVSDEITDTLGEYQIPLSYIGTFNDTTLGDIISIYITMTKKPGRTSLKSQRFWLNLVYCLTWNIFGGTVPIPRALAVTVLSVVSGYFEFENMIGVDNPYLPYILTCAAGVILHNSNHRKYIVFNTLSGIIHGMLLNNHARDISNRYDGTNSGSWIDGNGVAGTTFPMEYSSYIVFMTFMVNIDFKRYLSLVRGVVYFDIDIKHGLQFGSTMFHIGPVIFGCLHEEQYRAVLQCLNYQGCPKKVFTVLKNISRSTIPLFIDFTYLPDLEILQTIWDKLLPITNNIHWYYIAVWLANTIRKYNN